MKASDLLTESKPAMPQRLCRDFEAIRYLKSKVVFDRLVDADWLRPVFPAQHRLMLFDYHDLDSCIERMKEEGLPQSSSMSASPGAK